MFTGLATHPSKPTPRNRSDDVGRRVCRDVDPDAVDVRPLAHDDRPLLERLAQRERAARELHLPRLDLGKVEDVVDQQQQVVAGREDVFEVLRLI